MCALGGAKQRPSSGSFINKPVIPFFPLTKKISIASLFASHSTLFKSFFLETIDTKTCSKSDYRLLYRQRAHLVYISSAIETPNCIMNKERGVYGKKAHQNQPSRHHSAVGTYYTVYIYTVYLHSTKKKMAVYCLAPAIRIP